MACRDLDFLWKDYQFRDNRKGKRHTGELLWVHALHNPPCAQEEFRRGPLKDGEFGAWVLNAHQKSPSRTALLALIKACGKEKDLLKGSRIHAHILERGLLKKDISLGNALISMYAKCGALANAQGLFNQLPARNVVTWNALIAAYIQHGLCDEALSCFGWMQDQGLSPNAITFICILKACGSIGSDKKGEEIHAKVDKQGLLENDVVLGTALVDMYAKCGALAKAQGVFDKLPTRNVVTWNAIIGGYAEQRLGNKALSCFERMQDEGVSPNSITFISILKACSGIGAAERGDEIYAEVSRQGLLSKETMLGTALVDMYAKCGLVVKAQGVFDKLPQRNAATYTALIDGYAEQGLGHEALTVFKQMRDISLSPDIITFICVLKACSRIGAVERGEEIHAEINRQGLLENNTVLGTALVDMYARCGSHAKAQEVFEKLPARNIVAWNALIFGYAQHGLGDEALSCFGRMHDEGLLPNTVTFACILKACSSIGAADKGEEVHGEVSRQGLLEKDIMLGTALVDMYAKSGALAKAQEVFDELPERGVATWTALIAGYSQVGKVKIVFDSFIKMIGEGTVPNEVTFGVLLTACSHSGLVEEGQMYFDTMNTVYCIIPNSEHCVCLVDMFSRAGQFDKAVKVIEKVLPSDCLLLWSALIGACGKWVNVEIGRWAFEHAVELDEKFVAAYTCMRNIYAAAGMQEEANKVEALKVKNGAWKIPGCCWWTDASQTIHLFNVGDKSHPHSTYTKLKDINKKLQMEGFSHWLSQAITDDGKEDVLCGHTERFAITFALINTPEDTPIRVTKNMRICGDCHFATSLISKMEKRRIQVIDANLIHIFQDGKCLCEDYW